MYAPNDEVEKEELEKWKAIFEREVKNYFNNPSCENRKALLDFLSDPIFYWTE